MNILNELEKEIHKHFAKVGTLKLNKHTKRDLTLDISDGRIESLKPFFLQKRHQFNNT